MYYSENHQNGFLVQTRDWTLRLERLIWNETSVSVESLARCECKKHVVTTSQKFIVNWSRAKEPFMNSPESNKNRPPIMLNISAEWVWHSKTKFHYFYRVFPFMTSFLLPRAISLHLPPSRVLRWNDAQWLSLYCHRHWSGLTHDDHGLIVLFWTFN